MIRNSLVPIASFGSQAAWILFLIGFIFAPESNLMNIGIVFLTVIFFILSTLPVEFNASSRGYNAIRITGVLSSAEITLRKKF